MDLKRALKEAQEKFPEAEIFIPVMNFSKTLLKKRTRHIVSFEQIYFRFERTYSCTTCCDVQHREGGHPLDW